MVNKVIVMFEQFLIDQQIVTSMEARRMLYKELEAAMKPEPLTESAMVLTRRLAEAKPLHTMPHISSSSASEIGKFVLKQFGELG